MNKVDNPLVSILIPMYNSETYISETIESCLNQSYEPVEIIIVDDGSNDSSYKICEEYSAKFDFIYLYSQNNSGAPAARNLAFKKAKGKYIQYLDADDILSRDKIKNQVEKLASYSDLVLSYTNFKRFHTDINPEGQDERSGLINYSNSIDFYNDLIENGWLQTSCWLVSSELVRKTGDWIEDLSRNQDGDFFGRVILNSQGGVFSEHGTVYYRVNNTNSISSKPKDKRFFESFVRSFYLSADFIAEYGTDNQKIVIAKRINGFYEKLILWDSAECDLALEKIKRLGFRPNTIQNPIVKYLKYIIGYRNAIRLKFYILNKLSNR